MTLKMLCMQVGLVTVRTRVFSIGILLRNHVFTGLSAARHRRVGSTGRAREDTTSTLRTNHVCRSLLILHERCLLTHVRVAKTWKASHGTADTSRRHWPDCR
jgi:hypothetical protein